MKNLNNRIFRKRILFSVIVFLSAINSIVFFTIGSRFNDSQETIFTTAEDIAIGNEADLVELNRRLSDTAISSATSNTTEYEKLGMYDISTSTFYLSQDNSTIDVAVNFGNEGSRPLIGDWNGDGTYGMGTYSIDQSSSIEVIHFKNNLTNGIPEYQIGIPTQYRSSFFNIISVNLGEEYDTVALVNSQDGRIIAYDYQIAKWTLIKQADKLAEILSDTTQIVAANVDEDDTEEIISYDNATTNISVYDIDTDQIAFEYAFGSENNTMRLLTGNLSGDSKDEIFFYENGEFLIKGNYNSEEPEEIIRLEIENVQQLIPLVGTW